MALDSIVRTSPDYPHELLVVRKELTEKQPEAIDGGDPFHHRGLPLHGHAQGAHRRDLSEIYRREGYEGRGEAYDALLAMHGWGVNGGMTRKGLEAAVKLAVENGATKTALPVEAWRISISGSGCKQIGTVAE